PALFLLGSMICEAPVGARVCRYRQLDPMLHSVAKSELSFHGGTITSTLTQDPPGGKRGKRADDDQIGGNLHRDGPAFGPACPHDGASRVSRVRHLVSPQRRDRPRPDGAGALVGGGE